MGEAETLIENANEVNEKLLLKVDLYGGLDEPENIIEKAGAPGSKRLKTDREGFQNSRLVEDNKYYKPPTNLDILSKATLVSSRLAKSINIMTKNVVGLGHEVVDILSVTEKRNVDEATDAEIEKQKDDLEKFLLNANDDKDFDQLMSLIKTDEEAVGNSYMEITRTNDNKVIGLGHLPARTMRVRKDEEGFIQIRGDKARFFIPFGSDLLIDPKSGEEVEGVLRDQIATEVIHFKLEHPSDDFYGIPRWFPAIHAITGNRLADIRNIKFMENDATPRIAILISGGNLDPASVESIEKFIDLQGKGVENASRVMVLQTERKQIGPVAGESPKIELRPLTVGIEDDASFLKYRSANNDELKEVFGIGDLFYGMSRDINRAAAAVAKQTTNEQEFEPERKRIAGILKHVLLPKLDFDTSLVTIKFNSPVINDLASLADGFSKAAAAGALSPNDIRRMINQPTYPKTPEYDWADFPIVIATLFLEAGLFGLADDFDDQPQRQPGNRKPKPEGEETEDDEDEEDENEEKSQLGILNMMMRRVTRRARTKNILRQLNRDIKEPEKKKEVVVTQNT